MELKTLEAKKKDIIKAENCYEEILPAGELAIASLNTAGATVEKACRVLNEMLGANQVTVDKYGEEHISADHRVRHLGVVTILEIHKVLKDKSTVQSIGIFQDPTIIADATRVLKLRDKA